MSTSISRRARLCVSLLAALVVVECVVPSVSWAAGNDVGANLSRLLRHLAGELYAGVIAVVGLMFLVHRRYAELVTFLIAAVVVAWLVFSPTQVADAARAIGNQIL